MAERGDACPLNARQYANPTSLWSVPRLGARAAELRDRVIVLGRLRRDTWRGGDAVEMRVEELLEGSSPPARGEAPRRSPRPSS